jgi:hypothetical protein
VKTDTWTLEKHSWKKNKYHLTRKSAHTQNGILDPEMPKIW